MSFAVPHTLDARRDAAAEATAIAERLGDPTLGFWAAIGAFQVAVGAGSPTGIRDSLERLGAAADEIGRPSFHWIAGNLRNVITAVTEGPEASEALATENFAIGSDAGEPDAFDYFAFSIMTARWIQGRGAEVVDQVRQAVVDNPAVATVAAVLAEFLSQGGADDEARALLHEQAARDFEYPINNAWSATPLGWARIADHLDDATGAETLYAILAPWAGQIACNRIFAQGPVDGGLGRLARLLGRYEEAEAFFTAAEEQSMALGADIFTAQDDVSRAKLAASARRSRRSRSVRDPGTRERPGARFRRRRASRERAPRGSRRRLTTEDRPTA